MKHRSIGGGVLRRLSVRLGQRISAILLGLLAIGAVSVTFGTQTAWAAGGPQLGKTAYAAPSGQVFLTTPGGTRARLASAHLIPMGSILDTQGRHATVRITTAINASGATQSARFTGGPFQIEQPADERGTVNVDLVDRRISCTQASASRAGIGGGASTHVNTKSGVPSHWRVAGHSGSGHSVRRGRRYATAASVQTADWTTTDSCHGAKMTTTIIDNFGEVATTGGSAALQHIPASVTLTGDDRVAYSCSGGKVPYCAVLESSDPSVYGEQTPTYRLTFVTRNQAAGGYDLTISTPENNSTITYYPLAAGADGYRHSYVTCVPDEGKGQYDIIWRLSGAILADIIYKAPVPSPADTSCTSVPFAPATPADLSQSTLSARKDFDIHYTTAPGDPNAVPNGTAYTVANTAEQALSYYEKTLLMPPWKSPITGPINIYIEASTIPFADDQQVLSEPLPNHSKVPAAGQPTPAYITLFPRSYDDPYTVGSAVFSALLDEGIGNISPVENASLPDSTTVWAADNFVNSLGNSATSYEVNYPPYLAQPLDCDLSCNDDPPDDKWRFFQYLDEQHGAAVVAQILENDALDIRRDPAPHMDEAIQAALPAGVTLGSAMAGYVLEDLSNSWTETDSWVGGTFLAVGNPLTPVLRLGQSFGPQTVHVEHLAADWLKLSIPASPRPCTNETLTLATVVPPGGIVPGASLYINGRFSAVVQSVPSSDGVTNSVVLNSCFPATVRLPFVNGTLNTAPLSFTVTGSLTG